MRRTPAVLAFAIAVGAGALMLGGCHGPAGPLPEPGDNMYRGTPPGSGTELRQPDPLADPDSTIQVILLKGGSAFAAVTYGSSSCPVVSTGSTVLSPNHVAIEAVDTYEDPRSQACTDDLAPMTHVFDVPPDVDRRQPLTISILGQERRLSLNSAAPDVPQK
ncbi:hypothetical protein E4J89_12420 [Arthrobacter sp. CAU 1506]|uniref:hypothetical protein n=1 Tax=Arthrobacter sp. CAU 1506 TaxID=2560052 RepID=UPI0010AD31BC|nr:hypothetical protein [Arthrobacter sp. CAU 1506]TJY69003.1 hypothetical protein E4J89_12420 [Arthrobacter sp. CAU 1506]